MASEHLWAAPIPLEKIISELRLIISDCKQQIELSTRKEHSQALSVAIAKIGAAIELLENGLPPDAENAVRELPGCSQLGCRSAAGAVVDGRLLCGSHASQALSRRRAN